MNKQAIKFVTLLVNQGLAQHVHFLNYWADKLGFEPLVQAQQRLEVGRRATRWECEHVAVRCNPDIAKWHKRLVHIGHKREVHNREQRELARAAALPAPATAAAAVYGCRHVVAAAAAVVGAANHEPVIAADNAYRRAVGAVATTARANPVNVTADAVFLAAARLEKPRELLVCARAAGAAAGAVGPADYACVGAGASWAAGAVLLLLLLRRGHRGRELLLGALVLLRKRGELLDELEQVGQVVMQSGVVFLRQQEQGWQRAAQAKPAHSQVGKGWGGHHGTDFRFGEMHRV